MSAYRVPLEHWWAYDLGCPCEDAINTKLASTILFRSHGTVFRGASLWDVF